MSYQFMMPDIIPYHAHWDITTGCNQKCVFCLTSSGKRDPNELSTEDAFTLVDKLYDEGIWFLKILGGEPFFRKDTLKLMKYAADKGMILSFSTNASLIDDTIASNLFEIRNSIIYLQMSLYGESKETYQEITGSELNFDRALRGLKLLVDRGIDVTILTVATENNAHKVLKYYDIAKTYGAKEFRLTTEIALGRSAGKLKQKLEKTPRIWSTLINSLKAIKDSMENNGPSVLIDAKPLLGSYLHKLTGIYNFYENCNAGTTMLYIDQTGEVLPCPLLKQMPSELKGIYNHLLGSENIMKKPFKEIWESETFQIFRSYYNPENNLFNINTNCKYFRNRTCIPCTITPCNCMDMIKSIKKELDN